MNMAHAILTAILAYFHIIAVVLMVSAWFSDVHLCVIRLSYHFYDRPTAILYADPVIDGH